MKPIAKNNCVWVIRDNPELENGGIAIPDSAKKKAHKGKIITVGKLVVDRTIVEGGTAIFNQTSGFELELEDITYVVLRDQDIVGTI